ncbi:hypothetical protein E8E13_010626 [Curvularia kusanoi]|uniref:Uncharacterized protein n=1 Tax=Curvularia kusanoi TaxID=90978 RepID=A0A9P4WE76_CURKU|nr:hypothetical protein E8E13_010626 [Curvularia kusanoi]
MPTDSSHNFSWPTKVLTRSFSNISLASKKGIKGAASLFYDAPVAQHSEAPLVNASTGSIPDMTMTALPRIPSEALANIPAIPTRFLNGPPSALRSDVQASAPDTPITTKSAKEPLWAKMSRKFKKLLHIKWFKKGGGEDDAEQQVLDISSPTDFRHVQGFSTSALRPVQTINKEGDDGPWEDFETGPSILYEVRQSNGAVSHRHCFAM